MTVTRIALFCSQKDLSERIFRDRVSAVAGSVSGWRLKVSVLFAGLVNITFAYRIMDLYDALHEMRRLSDKNAPFEFTYMSCDLTRAKSQGVIHVSHGRLLSRERKDTHKDADIVERYINLDTMETRHFYQPLLMTFNGIKVNLQ